MGPQRQYAATETRETYLGQHYIIDENTERLVNAALHLRRPLLVTGNPGTGKSTLAYSIAWQLNLWPVYTWPINSRSTRKEGLYSYDAIARLQDKQYESAKDFAITDYIRLGPLGSAMAPRKSPRVLLIDEIDKSDIDLPNDLLDVLEKGEFEIDELARLSTPNIQNVPMQGGEKTPVVNGMVRCTEFPIVVLTSNGEREFPPAFLRRCLQLVLPDPTPTRLAEIVAKHLKLDPSGNAIATDLINQFLERRKNGDLSTDQLLNTIYLLTNGSGSGADNSQKLVDALYKPLSNA